MTDNPDKSKDDQNPPNPTPTALGSIAEQSVKDAVVRGRKRRAHRTNVSSAEIQVTSSVRNTNPASLVNPDIQRPNLLYHKRRRTALISSIDGDDDEEDSNDEWEEHVQVDPDRALALQRQSQQRAQTSVASKRINDDVKQSNGQEDSNNNNNNDDDSIQSERKKSKQNKLSEERMKSRQRKLAIAYRKKLLRAHSVHISILISQLLRHDSVAQRNDDVRALALSTAPEELFNQAIPQRERASIFALWTRATFRPTVHVVKLDGTAKPLLYPRLCNVVERVASIVGNPSSKLDGTVGDILDILTIAASVSRLSRMRCRIVSPLQLIPHQTSKAVTKQMADTKRKRMGGNKTQVSDVVVQTGPDAEAKSIVYGWLEVMCEGKWRVIDIFDGTICIGEAADVIRKSAERVPEYCKSEGKNDSKLNNSTSLHHDQGQSSRTKTSGRMTRRRTRQNTVNKKKEENETTESEKITQVVDEFVKRRTLPPNFFTHVVAVEDGMVTDVSRRYSTSWSEIEKARASGKLFEKNVSALGRPLQSDQEKEAEKEEQKEFDERAALESVPKTVTAVQKHPRYILERHVKKYELIHPRDPIMGYINDEPVFLRSNVHLLHTKDRWIRQMREVIPDCKPLKKVRSKNGTDATVDLFGEWQTRPLHIEPVGEDGTIPTGQHGNVDLWTEDHMPAGGVHVNLSYAKRAAIKLGVNFAPAMTGFELRRNRPVPRIEGVVVALQHESAVRDAATELEAAAYKRQEERNKMEALQRWAKLLRTMKARETVRKKYGGMDGMGISYETKQKRDGARRAWQEKHGHSDFEKDGDEIKKDNFDMKRNDNMEVDSGVHTHEYEEERCLEGDTWVKTCRICGIDVTFEKL